MREMRFFNFTRYTIICLILFTIAIVCGAIGVGMISGENMEILTEYMKGFFSSVPKGSMNLALSSIKKYSLVWMSVFAAGFIVPGFLLNLSVIRV